MTAKSTHSRRTETIMHNENELCIASGFVFLAFMKMEDRFHVRFMFILRDRSTILILFQRREDVSIWSPPPTRREQCPNKGVQKTRVEPTAAIL